MCLCQTHARQNEFGNITVHSGGVVGPFQDTTQGHRASFVYVTYVVKMLSTRDYSDHHLVAYIHTYLHAYMHTEFAVFFSNSSCFFAVNCRCWDVERQKSKALLCSRGVVQPSWPLLRPRSPKGAATSCWKDPIPTCRRTWGHAGRQQLSVYAALGSRWF